MWADIKVKTRMSEFLEVPIRKRMKKEIFLLVCFLFFLALTETVAQRKPILAVPALQGIEVPSSVASVCRNIVVRETGSLFSRAPSVMVRKVFLDGISKVKTPVLFESQQIRGGKKG